MSNFTLPIQAHALDSDVTAITFIDADGSATFTSGITVSAPATFNTGVTVSGKVQSGPSGAQAQMALNAVLTCTNLTSGPSTIRLPANSQICDIWLLCTVSGSGNSQGVNVNIGTSADATHYGFLKASAQSRIYRSPDAPNATAVSAAAWRIGASNVQLHIDVTGATTAAGAVDNFEAILSVQYVR